MSNEKMREEFQKQYGVETDYQEGEERSIHFLEWCAWKEAWKASRAALCVELPFVRCYAPNEASSDVDYWIDEAHAIGVRECRSAIESTGVRTATKAPL
jgi:hypothetical protein